MPELTCSRGRQRDEKCVAEHKYTDTHAKAYMCVVHQQWMYEFPTKVIYVYADGTTYERLLK